MKDMNAHYVIELEQSWTVPDFTPICIARVFEVSGAARRRWPMARQKPVVSLMGTDDSIASALEQTRLWVAGGCKTAAQIKDEASA